MTSKPARRRPDKPFRWFSRVPYSLLMPVRIASPWLVGTLLNSVMSRAASASEPAPVEASSAPEAPSTLEAPPTPAPDLRLAQKLAVINRSVQDVMFNLDSEDALRVACLAALEISGADGAAVLLADTENRRTLRLGYGLHLTPELEERLAASSARTLLAGDTRAIRHVDQLEADDPLRDLLTRAGFRTAIDFVIKSGNTVSGLLAVYFRQPYPHDPVELELLETLAYQMSAALDNAELLRALEVYASEQAQLVHLSRISTSSLQLDTVVDRITYILRQMMSVDRVIIGLGLEDRDNLKLFNRASSGGPAQFLPLVNIPELSLMRQQPHPSPRIFYQSDGQASEPLSAWMSAQDCETMALVPMIVNSQFLGLIFLGHGEQRLFSDSEWRMVEMAANQVGAQLHNAYVHDATEQALRKRLQQLSLIEDLAQQISGALEVDQLLRNLLDAAVSATQADLGALGIITDSGRMRVLGKEARGGEWITYDHFRPLHAGLMGRVIQSGEVIVIPDNSVVPDYLIENASGVFRSSLIVPLISKDRVVGVLNLESRQSEFFREDQVSFLKSLAGHAVISMQNTRLLQEQHRQIDTLTRLRDLSLQLAADTDSRVVVQSILHTAMAVLRGQSAALYHHANETGELHFVAGVRAEGDKLIPARPLIPDAIPYRAARTGQLQLVEDLHASEDFRRYDDYPNLDYGGLVALPIRRGNGVDEVLCVALPSGRQWSHFDHQTLELLLIQAGGHLENAALYDNVDSGNRRMRAILDSARDGIIMLDRHGILSEFNVSAERILNVDLGDYRGENFALALLNTARAGGFSEDNTRDVLTEMARVLRTEPQRITNRSLEIRRGSEIRYVEEVGSPVFDSRRNITGRLLTLRDVTEERLLAAYRDEISNMVVHDLKSPLSTIITSLTLAVDILSLVEPRHDDLDVVEQTLQVSLSSATALLSLVESLLDIAKLETRHMPLRRAPASFNDIVQNAYMALAAFAQEAHIHVDLRVPAHLPPVDVDADKIRRVVINLLDNALRYTPSGGMIQVSAAMSDHKVLVRVADSGRGIPPEESEHIFEKFRQIANNNPSRGKKGVGLGLTFCKLTLEAHGERIWVDHDGPLPGACFAFTLPTASVPAGSPLHSA